MEFIKRVYISAKVGQSTTYQFIHASVQGACNGNAAQTVLNLEEGDAILAQTPTVNVIKGVISYALIDRTGENG